MSDVEMTFPIMRARSAHEKRWPTASPTLKQVRELFEIHVSSDKKDGPAFVPAVSLGESRTAAAITHISMLVFDVDGGQTYDEVRDRVAQLQCFAIIFTTYSHLTKTTTIKTDNYVKWAKKKKVAERHDLENVTEYLREKGKDYLTNLSVEDQPRHTDDGYCIIVNHDPVHKIRIVMPLHEVYDVAKHGGYTSAEHINTWKRRYLGAGTKLGLNFDRTCSDPSRLYYCPSHPSGTRDHKVEFLEGPLVNIHDFPMAEPEEVQVKRPVAGYASDGVQTTRTENELRIGDQDVNEWFRKRGRGLGQPLIDLMRDNPSIDVVRSERGNGKLGWHIECPFEDEHTKAGGDGTFLDPGENEDSYPKLHCCHSHCEGRSTEEYLVKMIENGWFVFEDLRQAAREIAMIKNGMHSVAAASRTAFEQKRYEEMRAEPDALSTDEEQEIMAAVKITKSVSIEQTTADYRALVTSPVPVIPNDKFELLRRTTTSVDMYRTFDALMKETGQDNIAFFLYVLTVSDVGFRAIKAIYAREADKIELNYPDFKVLIRDARREKFSITSAVETLVLSSLQNVELNLRIEQLADFYGVTFREIKQAHKDSFLLGAGGDVERQIRERAEKINAKYIKVLQASGVYYIVRGKPVVGNENNVRLYSTTAMMQAHSNENIEVRYPDGRTKVVNTFEWWTKFYPDPTTCDRVAFRPDKAPHRVEDGVFNSFEGFLHPMKKGDVSPFVDHIDFVWCKGDKAVLHWIITWLAHILQKPAEKGSTSLVVNGGQGTGKSVIFEECMGVILKSYYFLSMREQDLVGNFNAHMARNLLFVAEEAAFGKSRRLFSRIKGLISGHHRVVEAKGRDAQIETNYSRYVFLTNELQAVHAEADDRRFVILNTGDRSEESERRGREFAEWCRAGGNAHVMHYLKNWDPTAVGMSWQDVYRAPMTSEKIEQKKRSARVSIEGYFIDAVLEGNVRLSREESLFWDIDEPLSVEVGKMRQAYIDWAKTFNTGTNYEGFDEIQMANFVRVPKGEIKQRLMDNQICYVFPPRRKLVELLLARRLITQDDHDSAIRLGTTHA